jgi:hypothetical protein
MVMMIWELQYLKLLVKRQDLSVLEDLAREVLQALAYLENHSNLEVQVDLSVLCHLLAREVLQALAYLENHSNLEVQVDLSVLCHLLAREVLQDL